MNIKVFVDYQDGNGFFDISDFVKYDTLSISINAFSTSYKYSQNECSFDIIYNFTEFAYMSQTHKDIILRIIDLKTGNAAAFIADPSLFFTCEASGTATALFYGHIPNSKSWSYNGIADNTVISVEATDDLDYLDVPAGDIVCSNCHVLYPADKSHSIAHYLLFKGNWGDSRIYTSDFSNTTDNWNVSGGNFTVDGKYLIVSVISSVCYIYHAFSFSGTDNPFISFDINSKNNIPVDVRIYYSTGMHGYSDSYYKQISFSDNTGTWANLSADMSDLTVGGNDWINNVITGIKIVLEDSVAGGTIQLCDVIIGGMSRVSSDVTIDTVIEKCVPDDEDTSILTMLDTLFYEYGYCLSCNAMGYISPVKWQVTSSAADITFNEDNIIDKISVSDAVNSYDGVKLTYYKLGSADKVLLYRDDNCEYGDTGVLKGYDVLSGYFYPVDANVIDTTTGINKVVEQEYTDSGITYVTNYAIVHNLDYYKGAFSSDYSSIVATANHYMDMLADDGLTTVIQSFGNKKCRLLYKNNTSGVIKLYANNVFGTVWYKTSELTYEADIKTVPVNRYDYTSTFIFDDTTAALFTKSLVTQYNTGLVTFSFTSADSAVSGTMAHIYSASAGIDIFTLIRSVKYDSDTELYTYTCLSCSYDLLSLTNSSTRQIANVNYAYPYVLSLSRTAITIPFTDKVADYSSAYTDISIVQNGINMTAFFSLYVTAPSGITGVLSGNRYTITSFTGVGGTLIVTAMKGDITLTKTIDVTYSGDREAPDVKWATDISLTIDPAVVAVVDTTVIGNGTDVLGEGDYVFGSPGIKNTIIAASASMLYVDGSSYAYAGRFVITADSVVIYTSAEDESSCSQLIGVNALSVVVKLYEAGGIMNLLDTQTMGIVTSVNNLIVFAKNGHLAYTADADGYVNASVKKVQIVAYRGLNPVTMFLWVRSVPAGFNLAVADDTAYITALAGKSMPESGSICLSTGYSYVFGEGDYVFGDASFVFGMHSVSEEESACVDIQYDKVYLS